LHFHLTVCNHGPGRHTLIDLLTWVKSGLEDNGHKVIVSQEEFSSKTMNIFWEYFEPKMATFLMDSEVPFGLIATELPDGAGFNGRRDEVWVARWEGFKMIAPHARFIWSLVEEAVPAYAAFAPAAFLELGFTQRLVSDTPTDTPSHDFSFTGTANTYRERILDRLARTASVNTAGGLVNRAEQQQIQHSGRMALALKQSPDWRWSSPARLGILLHQRVPIAAERTAVDDPVSRLVPTPGRDEDFVDWALGRLDRTDLQTEADGALEAYRAQPMRDCVARALDLTLQ
jgi:hypothetical protein